MGWQCCFPSCKNTSGLHSFPAHPEFRHKWVRALGILNRDLPARAGVCNRHFSRDCFSNLMEVDMGFTEVLMLKSKAVPNFAVPGRAASCPGIVKGMCPIVVHVCMAPREPPDCLNSNVLLFVTQMVSFWFISQPHRPEAKTEVLHVTPPLWMLKHQTHWKGPGEKCVQII